MRVTQLIQEYKLKDNVYLRHLKKEDSIKMLEWMHDESIAQFFQVNFKSFTNEQVEQFIEQHGMYESDTENRHFAVADIITDEYLGTISLKHIDFFNGSAEYAIVLRKSAQGRGIGTEASKRLLEYAFVELGLKEIYLHVICNNYKAISMYKKVGFEYVSDIPDQIVLGKPMKSEMYAIRK